MGKVIFNMTVSLDGFVAGLNDSPENGLGDGGEGLFTWYFTGDVEVPLAEGHLVLKVSAPSAKILSESFETYGAGVWGRRTFDITQGWGGNPPGSPAFVVTHNIPEEWVYDGSPFVFVTDGIESAIRQAKQAAGDKNVVLCTATILQQALNLGLVDEIYVDVAPFLLGKGVRLFDHLNIAPTQLENILAVSTPSVTHLGFRVLKEAQPTQPLPNIPSNE